MAWDVVGSAIASINSAIELARSITNAPGVVERAELQHKLAGMMLALADAKGALADARLDMIERDDRISALEEALEAKGSIVRVYDAYYDLGDEGKPIGDPYCMRCWEADHFLMHLTRGGPGVETKCTRCGTTYSRNRVPFAIESSGQ